MTHKINSDQMANVRRSLAEAGIYFDKLYISQAYFNSQITIEQPVKKSRKHSPSLWHKLLCGLDAKRTSIGTQTTLTVRDDQEIPPIRPRLAPSQNMYDRRRTRPVLREHRSTKEQELIRHRPSSMAIRSVPSLPSKAKIINHDTDEDNNEFAV